MLGLAGSLKAAGTLGALAGSQAGAALAAALSALLLLRFAVAPASRAAQALPTPMHICAKLGSATLLPAPRNACWVVAPPTLPAGPARPPRLQLRFAIQRAMKPAREVRRVRRVPARARGLQASP